jgi:predicted glycosyltransferase
MQQSLNEYYEAVWIYGDPAVYDPVSEYGLKLAPHVKVHYTGYLDPCSARESLTDSSERLLHQLSLPSGRLALCVVGGGEDGGALATAFTRARLPPDMNGVLVTGPLMPATTRDQLQRSVACRDRMRVVEFLTEPEPLMHAADRVISMGGYNTVCEVLALGKQSLIVPRVKPRREQLIRAERLRDLQFVDVLRPDQLSPNSLTKWLWKMLPARPSVREHIDFGGLGRLPHLITELTGAKHGSSQTCAFAEERINART